MIRIFLLFIAGCFAGGFLAIMPSYVKIFVAGGVLGVVATVVISIIFEIELNESCSTSTKPEEFGNKTSANNAEKPDENIS